MIDQLIIIYIDVLIIMLPAHLRQDKLFPKIIEFHLLAKRQ